MLRVGLTGGIGAGKSTVARRLSERGAVVVDADAISREVVALGTDGLAAIVATFGPDVLLPDGTLDRPALAARVFGDDDARQQLNAIVHPRVGARRNELIAAAPPDAVIVDDIPLLVENRLAPGFHLVVVVDAPVEERVRRLVEQRGLPEADARARMAAQATDAERRAVADIWLDNTGAPGALAHHIDQLWDGRLAPYAHNLQTGARAPRSGPVIADPDPTWRVQAERIAARVRRAAGGRALAVDHVGSTAVPGLGAKDVIDLQLTVATLDDTDDLAADLAAAGLPAFVDVVVADTPKPSEPDPERWRKRLHVNADPGRAVNLHVRDQGSAGWRFALLFRDWMRAEPAERAGYEAHKRALAAAHASDPDSGGYAEAKEPWFDTALERAETWAARTAWTPTPSFK